MHPSLLRSQGANRVDPACTQSGIVVATSATVATISPAPGRSRSQSASGCDCVVVVHARPRTAPVAALRKHRPTEIERSSIRR